MLKKVAVVENGEVTNVVMVEVDDNGEIEGMKGHPLAGKLDDTPGLERGMIRSADGQFRRPDDVGRPDEPGAP